MAWPGHISLISRNQPSENDQFLLFTIHNSVLLDGNQPLMVGCVISPPRDISKTNNHKETIGMRRKDKAEVNEQDFQASLKASVELRD
jgi:hypothetical protein